MLVGGFLCPFTLLQAARAAAQIRRGKRRHLLGNIFLKSSGRTSPAQLDQGLLPCKGAAGGAALLGCPQRPLPATEWCWIQAEQGVSNSNSGLNHLPTCHPPSSPALPLSILLPIPLSIPMPLSPATSCPSTPPSLHVPSNPYNPPSHASIQAHLHLIHCPPQNKPPLCHPAWTFL